MSNKYLPIKIFEKRKDYDDRSTEGGGDNREPGFVLHGDELQAHAQVLASDLQEVRSQFREALSQKRTLPVIVATSLNDSAIAKTHRKRVVNILESDGNDNVVGVYGDRQILSVLPDEAVLDNLENSIYKEESATLTSSLTGIEVFHPIVDEYKDGTDCLIIMTLIEIAWQGFYLKNIVKKLVFKFRKESDSQRICIFTESLYLLRTNIFGSWSLKDYIVSK